MLERLPTLLDAKKQHPTTPRGQDLVATLRAGPNAFPGGYPLYLLTDDGGVLHFDCAKENLYQCIWEIRNDVSGGWRVVACQVNYEDPDLICGNTPLSVVHYNT